MLKYRNNIRVCVLLLSWRNYISGVPSFHIMYIFQWNRLELGCNKGWNLTLNFEDRRVSERLQGWVSSMREIWHWSSLIQNALHIIWSCHGDHFFFLKSNKQDVSSLKGFESLKPDVRNFSRLKATAPTHWEQTEILFTTFQSICWGTPDEGVFDLT